MKVVCGDNSITINGKTFTSFQNFYTAKELARDFDVPLLWAFEYFGTERDINHVKEQLHAIADTDCTDCQYNLF